MQFAPARAMREKELGVICWSRRNSRLGVKPDSGEVIDIVESSGKLVNANVKV